MYDKNILKIGKLTPEITHQGSGDKKLIEKHPESCLISPRAKNN